MGYLVHVAGPPPRAGNVIRQRCAWCGAVLDENDLDRVAWQVEPGAEHENPFVEEDGSPKSRWVGLVAVEESGDGGMTAKYAVDDPDDGKIPVDSCMALDPAATS